jgi:hypothetical protein
MKKKKYLRDQMGYNQPIKDLEKYWYLRHVAKNVFVKNKHFACLCTGESGSGKSYATGGLAYQQYPELNPKETFSFSPLQFLEKAGQKQPKLFPLILDDAGLSAFSGDALKAHVKNISKICQSIRYKGWQVYINLPHIAMLAKSVKLNYQYLVQTLDIDFDTRENIIKFQRLKWDNRGEIMPKYPTRFLKEENEVTGYSQIIPQTQLNMRVDAPPQSLMKEYEKLKDEFLKKFYNETAEEMRASFSNTKESSKTRAFDIANEIRDKVDEYTNDKGRPWIEKIMMDYKINNSVARFAYKMANVPIDKGSARTAKKENKSLAKELPNQLEEFEKIAL